MKLQSQRPYIEAMLQVFPRLDYVGEQLCFGNKVEISFGRLRGWVFSAGITGKPLVYVVRRLDFTPPSEEETGKLFLELKANAKARLATATLRIAGTDIAGRTIPDVLAAKGFVKETPALLASYDEWAKPIFARGNRLSGYGPAAAANYREPALTAR